MSGKAFVKLSQHPKPIYNKNIYINIYKYDIIVI